MKYTVVLAALSLTPAASLVIPSPAVTTDRWIATGQQSTVHRDDMLLMFRRRRSFQTVVVDGGRRGHFHHCHRRRRLHGKCTMSVSTSLSEILPSSSAMMSILAWCPAGLAIALVGTSVVHALQGGVRGDLGKTQEEILGVRAEEATARDISRLGKADFMQLFYCSPCPSDEDLNGEYRAYTLDMGVLHPVASLITHRIWGPGRWLGKGISAGSAEGYNLFSSDSSAAPPVLSANSEGDPLPEDTQRARCFMFASSSSSVFGRGSSSKLNYGEVGVSNGPLFGGMRDELRKVNDQLFVGLGYIQAFGGKYNTAPFVLEGPPLGMFSSPDAA